jgi:hypothetical protein
MKSENFGGGQNEWIDWAFNFKRMIRIMDVECYELMEKVERVAGDFNEDALNEFTESGDVSGISGELYDLLCTTVKGDALLVLKSVEEFKGFVAWSKLFGKYNPRTTARAIKLLAEVCSPGQVKGAYEVEAAIAKWKTKVKTLEKEFGETIGENMKIAIITAMLPTNVQDYVFQTVSADTDFDSIMAKILVWVSNRVAMEGVPMDVGEVGDDWWSEDWEVDAVGAWTKCHSCEGYGHIARDCPHKKGKGKGKDHHYGKGYGYKGYDKGHGKGYSSKGHEKGYSYDKGYGKGYSSKGYDKGGGKSGKGYQGTCWKCGVVGHKALECTKQVQIVEEEGNKDATVEEVSVGGGVWVIGAVNTEWRKPKPRATSMPRTWSKPPGLKMMNMFKGLEGENDDEEGRDYLKDSPKMNDGTTIKNHVTNITKPSGHSSRNRKTTVHSSHPTESETMKYTMDDAFRNLYAKVGTAKLWSAGPGESMAKTLEGHDNGVNKSSPDVRFKTLEFQEGHDNDVNKSSPDMRLKTLQFHDKKYISELGASHAASCVQSFVDVGHVGIHAVEAGGRRAAMKFHVAAVQRPLASAVKVVQAGNSIILSKNGAYIQSDASGEKMPLRVERGTFVFDVEYADGSPGTITLDSGAGVNVWPEHLLPSVPMSPPEPGLRMTAANGTEIPSRGVKTVEFKSRGSAPTPGGSRHA